MLIADAFGLRDDHKCLSWVYLQRKGAKAIEIRIEVTYGGGLDARSQSPPS